MTEGKLLGVCAWLSDKFELDVTGIRLLFVAAAILGFGSPVALIGGFVFGKWSRTVKRHIRKFRIK